MSENKYINTKQMVIIMIFLIMLLVGSLGYLIYQVRQINPDGLKCVNNPLVYAEYKIKELKKEDYNCDCVKYVNDLPRLDSIKDTFNFSINLTK